MRSAIRLGALLAGLTAMTMACSEPEAPAPASDPAPLCTPQRAPSAIETTSAAALWTHLIAVERGQTFDAPHASALASSSASLAAYTSCGTASTAERLISDPFACTDDCKSTLADLDRALGGERRATLALLGAVPAVTEAIASSDPARILAAISAALKTDAVAAVVPFARDVRSLDDRATACTAWRKASCGAGGGGGGGVVPAAPAEVTGSYRWQWQVEGVTPGLGVTPTHVVMDTKIEFTLTVKSIDDSGAVTLEGPAKVDLVTYQGNLQNMRSDGMDCPAGFHITGTHVFDFKATGNYDRSTGKIVIAPTTITANIAQVFDDCLNGTQTSDPLPSEIKFEGCEGTIVNGSYDDQHEGRHPEPTGIWYIGGVVVQKDTDECHITVR